MNETTFTLEIINPTGDASETITNQTPDDLCNNLPRCLWVVAHDYELNNMTVTFDLVVYKVTREDH